MSFDHLTTEQLRAIIHGKHPALVRGGNDWITDELAAVGLQESDEAADNLIRKMAKTGFGLCKARTRRGSPCRALGDGAGGRCILHGGASVGPVTLKGKQNALQALVRARLKRRGIDPDKL
ncbi:HGGxSTG domain-containing protein [Thiomonas sp. FB-6]|uniref:HGGxSTG domain-containing protein n=1 Tax=Thiomonas sp. FB-6 TaxID=1158291 RepID=UPI000367588B|nr:HGGxSTG domain-containing protein [Thiomonas sp. FB-6]